MPYMYLKPQPKPPFWLIPAVIAFVLLIAVLAKAETIWDSYTDEQIVKAIYLAEGGSRATFSYGIRSIKYTTITEARQICFNSVRNGRERWVKADRPDDLIVFIGRRYCPPTAHRLNVNWSKNVKFYLSKTK